MSELTDFRECWFVIAQMFIKNFRVVHYADFHLKFLNSHSIRHYDPYFLKQFLLILRQFLYHNLSVEYQAYSLNMFTCFLHNGIIYCQNSILLNRVDQINVSSEYGSLVKLRGKKPVYLQLIHMIWHDGVEINRASFSEIFMAEISSEKCLN